MGSTKKKVICLSFKKEEEWLYEILMEYSSPTGTVKDILKSYFRQFNHSANPVETPLTEEKK